MQALFHMTYRNAFCGWLPILSLSKGRSKFMWCLFHHQVHTENTETHACMQTLQTGGSRGLDSHRCLSGSGTTPVHVTSEWQYSLSRSYMYTNTHLNTWEIHGVIFLCGYVSLEGPFMFMAPKKKRQRKTKKNSSWPEITTLPYIICVESLLVPLWIIKADVELLNKSLEGGCLIFLCVATLGTHRCLQSIICNLSTLSSSGQWKGMQ